MRNIKQLSIKIKRPGDISMKTKKSFGETKKILGGKKNEIQL